jgi:Papain family cysteine protease
MAVEVYHDLRNLFGPARDQGARPTCLAFAASDAHAALRVGWEPLSCEFAFYHAQRRANRSPAQGTTLPAILDALRHDGQPHESGWPYLASLPADLSAWRPPPGLGQLFNRAGRSGRGTVEEIVAGLDGGRPVIVLMQISMSFFIAGPDGIVDPAADERPDPAQRHAVVAVGHGLWNGERVILVRNSWGEAWGQSGHAWLTEAFLTPRVFGLAVLLENIDVYTSVTTA